MEGIKNIYFMTMLGLMAMVIAFITGTYALLVDYSVAIMVCILGYFLFFGLSEFLIYNGSIAARGPRVLPVSIPFFLTWWMIQKMKFGMCNLYDKCLRWLEKKTFAKIAYTL